MPNAYFRFKQFHIHQDRCAMKVTTDGCLFGAWVAEAIGKAQWEISRSTSQKTGMHLLDIGTGTGLLSLMVAQKQEVAIDAIEIDPAAAQQAKENIAASPWTNRINVINQNVLLWQTAKQYDAIFANPPFYQNELKSAKTEKNIAHHDEGLLFPDLLRFIREHLKEGGRFFLLLPAKREKELDDLLTSAGLFLQQTVYVQQTLKHQPFRLMIQGRLKKVERAPDQLIIIKNEAGEYTPEFVALLRDYYLYL